MSEITLLVQTPGTEMADIYLAGGKMLLCALGSLAASAVTAVCSARIAANLGANLRGSLFRKVESFSMEEIGRFSTDSLITREKVIAVPIEGEETLMTVIAGWHRENQNPALRRFLNSIPGISL